MKELLVTSEARQLVRQASDGLLSELKSHGLPFEVGCVNADGRIITADFLMEIRDEIEHALLEELAESFPNPSKAKT